MNIVKAKELKKGNVIIWNGERFLVTREISIDKFLIETKRGEYLKTIIWTMLKNENGIICKIGFKSNTVVKIASGKKLNVTA